MLYLTANSEASRFQYISIGRIEMIKSKLLPYRAEQFIKFDIFNYHVNRSYTDTFYFLGFTSSAQYNNSS